MEIMKSPSILGGMEIPSLELEFEVVVKETETFAASMLEDL